MATLPPRSARIRCRMSARPVKSALGCRKGSAMGYDGRRAYRSRVMMPAQINFRLPSRRLLTASPRACVPDAGCPQSLRSAVTSRVATLPCAAAAPSCAFLYGCSCHRSHSAESIALHPSTSSKSAASAMRQHRREEVFQFLAQRFAQARPPEIARLPT